MNKLVPEGYRNVYFHGAVKNLAWNKHSAELVVNWSYFVQQAECTLMPVLGSLDRVVDMIMVDKDLQVNSIMWNPDHTQLGEDPPLFVRITGDRNKSVSARSFLILTRVFVLGVMRVKIVHFSQLSSTTSPCACGTSSATNTSAKKIRRSRVKLVQTYETT